MSARPAFSTDPIQTLGLELAGDALRRTVKLSDPLACWVLLRSRRTERLGENLLAAARRLSIDVVQDAACHPDARLVTALRAIADLAERAITRARTEEHHLAGWRRISELADAALAEVAP